jgi:competence protein ComEA
VGERIAAWRGDARAGVIGLVVVAVLTGMVWYELGAARGDPPAARNAPTTEATGEGDRAGAAGATSVSDPEGAPSTSAANGSRAGAALLVHVAGAVSRPGVVDLPPGARVVDALDAVGGALAEADLDRLNLAAKLVDGQRIFVPRVGQADPAPSGAEPPDLAVPGATLNLNTATQAQLETLPGIGPTLALAIIDYRQRHGGFRSVNELRQVRGIGDRRFADLKDLVVV